MSQQPHRKDRGHNQTITSDATVLSNHRPNLYSASCPQAALYLGVRSWVLMAFGGHIPASPLLWEASWSLFPDRDVLEEYRQLFGETPLSPGCSGAPPSQLAPRMLVGWSSQCPVFAVHHVWGPVSTWPVSGDADPATGLRRCCQSSLSE